MDSFVVPAQTSQAPTTTRTTTMLVAGPLRVLVTDDPAHIVAAQRLRYRVFADEPGFSDAIGDPLTRTDADRFDAYCHHLVVIHDDDGMVGCARLLPPDRAIVAGGWYSDGEFETAGLSEIAASTVEMGRACVAADHRSGSVTALMWAAVLQYVDAGGHRYLMGCVSMPLGAPVGTGRARGADLHGVRNLVRDKHAAPWSVFPHASCRVDGIALDHIPAAEKSVIPPLLRGYLRLGAQVCGEPAIDEVFDVADFLTVIDRDGANRRYLDRLCGAIERLGGGR
ncbi:MAG: GNAT family N-acyltransferase [Gordonia sp. (in: high G+C Gram-positive bacteria)]